MWFRKVCNGTTAELSFQDILQIDYHVYINPAVGLSLAGPEKSIFCVQLLNYTRDYGVHLQLYWNTHAQKK